MDLTLVAKLKLYLFKRVPFKGLASVPNIRSICGSGFIVLEGFSVVIIYAVISHQYIKYIFFLFTGGDFPPGITHVVLVLELALMSSRSSKGAAALRKSETYIVTKREKVE